MPYLAFARQSVGDDFPEDNGERLLNLYAEPFPQGGTAQLVLAPSPGLTAFATLNDGPVKAVHVQGGVIYAISGATLYSVTPAGVVTALGAMTNGDFATLTGNGLDVAATSGGNYYVYTVATGSFRRVATKAFARAGSATRLDNYVIVSQRGGGAFLITGLADAGSIDALDFASAESAPDDIVRAVADHSELWLFGERTTEVWGNTGAADFPFQRLSGGVIQRGCAWPGSVARDDNSIFWVGDDRLVYRAEGYTPRIISTPWVAGVLQAEDAEHVAGFTYSWRGHKFYVLRPPGRPSLVYDVATGLWHERATGVQEGPWRATCAESLGERVILGGDDGRLYDLGGLTDGGEVIVREGVSAPVEAGGDRFSMHEVELVFRTGATDLGRAASVTLEVSRNGYEWGLEKRKTLGSVGQYLRRVRWHGLGVGRQFRVRFRVTDAIDTALIGAKYRAS